MKRGMRHGNNKRDGLRSAGKLLAAAALALLIGASASAQTTAGARFTTEPFAVYHDSLSAAAESTLAGLALGRGKVMEPPGNEVPATVKPSEEERIRAYALRHWNGRVQDLQAAVLRIRDLRPTVDPILLAEGLPAHLAAVILVESAGRPTALSPRSARGLWQFIPATARRYGLNVDSSRDERLDTAKATRAAARYLRDLYEQFGDWPLALAAYNAGEQAIERAVRKAGVADFWLLRSRNLLPVETQNYVPAVLGAMELLGAEVMVSPLPSQAAQRKFPVLYAQVGASE